MEAEMPIPYEVVRGSTKKRPCSNVPDGKNPETTTKEITFIMYLDKTPKHVPRVKPWGPDSATTTYRLKLIKLGPPLPLLRDAPPPPLSD